MSTFAQIVLIILGAFVLGVFGAVVGALLGSQLLGALLAMATGFGWGVFVAHIADELNSHD